MRREEKRKSGKERVKFTEGKTSSYIRNDEKNKLINKKMKSSTGQQNTRTLVPLF